jgi:hypothetical protein
LFSFVYQVQSLVGHVTAGQAASDLLGAAAAALAACSLALRDSQPSSAASYLQSAKQLYRLAKFPEGVYSQTQPEMQSRYNSSSYLDDLAWAAAWLSWASDNDAVLLDEAETYYKRIRLEGGSFYTNQ